MAGTPLAFSKADIQQLADQISQAHARATLAPSDVRDTFCRIWPNLDAGLKALEAIVGAIPGWGAIAKGAIAIVSAVGEAVNKALCGGH